jgi:hypothetical protein
MRLLGLIAILLLTACTAAPTRPSVVVAKVPAELAQEVPEPVAKGRTNGDLAELADELIAALREANRRLRKIREL